ncbi:ATP-binding cassette domain-containing protein [Flavobacterium cerinum]|uniref:ATP-binding cassette domain-containing protein n=1 Tax=Flavobacterium cerinum TaxID=2502784 RepID=A0ABY5INZ4_9FLAO|nr:ATP-binding cassette domain-containing protein [Flavobacterium cerinum]UUC44354.1 ATP-binding cassette domain-containing protein [Flavobacterium cerinum]
MRLFRAIQPEIDRFDIRLENVTFGYIKDINIVKGVSFHIKEQSKVALVGAAGSGKTTLTGLIARMWDPKKGRIKIGGTDITRIPQRQLIRYIDILSVSQPLPDDTLYNAIRSANPEATEDQIFDAAEKARVIDFAWELPDGMHTQLQHPEYRLSDDEKLRIHMARALLKKAPILILDETITVSDPTNRIYIEKAKQELLNGKTVIIITRDPETIKNVDQVLVMNDGKLEEHSDAVFYSNHTQQWNLRLEF